MSYDIQPKIFCETCIKCGLKPVLEQTRKGWDVLCPNKTCKNIVSGPFADIEGWNILNKKDTPLNTSSTLKNTA